MKAEIRYVSDDTEGITRKRRGKGFGYYTPEDNLVLSGKERERIGNLVIPPAWTDVWICPAADGHIQATGRDLKGRKQYIYHEHWKLLSSQSKFDNLLSFGESLPGIRKRVNEDLRRRNLDRDKILATVINLLDKTFMRIGNEQYSKLNGSYGLTTLKNKHVRIDGTTVEFSYLAKGGIQRNVKITDRMITNTIKKCQEIPGFRIFQFIDENGNRKTVNSEDVNGRLREITGYDFTTKDFRTWGATVAALHYLKEAADGEEQSTDRIIVAAVKEAAKRLGNTPATCRKYYIHPAITEAFTKGRITSASGVRNRRKYLSPEEVEVLHILKKAK